MKVASSAPTAPLAPFIRARKGPDEARPETFAILGRVAACLWFTLLTLLYAQPLAAMVHAIRPGDRAFADWVPVVSRVCTLAFLLVQAWLMLARRSPVARAAGLSPVVISLLGTYGVWVIAFLPQATASPAIELLSAAITLLGSLMIILTIAFLGRSFSIAPQARTLITSGPYRIVRHPLYLAEEIAIVGVLIHVAWYAAIPFMLIHLALQIRRMRYEETLLRSVFPEYGDYARRTARLIPGIW
jgi:protein-S-isoprenylcysteine O-methyltransferase Ste14